jgi:hypothetical protein
MHQERSRDPLHSRLFPAWARVTWGLLGATALSACGSSRTELCTTVHTRVLEELRTTDEAPHHVSDPWACERYARRLRVLADELRALAPRDEGLRQSLETYRAEVERLAEAYARLAAAYRSHPELSLEAARQVHKPLRREVLNHAAALGAPRLQLQRACGGG